MDDRKRSEWLMIAGLILILFLISAQIPYEETPPEPRRERLELPPCDGCTKPRKPIYTPSRKPDGSILWYVDGWYCPEPCID